MGGPKSRCGRGDEEKNIPSPPMSGIETHISCHKSEETGYNIYIEGNRKILK
jgi:hypothetical protein